MSLKYRGSVVLVGGAPFADNVFNFIETRSENFVAADGGADALLARGVIPDAVIGDMDSMSDAGRAAIPADRIHRVCEQDTTDFDKALRGIEAPLIYAIGFTGARLDHELAALHVLVRYCDRPVVLVGELDVTVHLPARISLDVMPGTRVSVFPLDTVTVGLMGLRYAFDALALHPLHRIGTSNEAVQRPVIITSDAPGALLILPREDLDAVTTALEGADLHSLRG